MRLKEYQQETLTVLADFLRRVREQTPFDQAFDQAAEAMERGRFATTYRQPAQLSGVPYICLRIPTGGGKTLLASYTVKLTAENLLEQDYPLAIWFTPTNTIRQQTVEALQNPRHPYRKVLDEAFDGRVRVLDIDQFEQLRPDDVQRHACIIVSTIQSLKTRDNTSDDQGRERLRVYRHREALTLFFADLRPEQKIGLELLDDGRPKASFANLLKLYRPLMIVDEAHNAVTGLTRELQKDIGPCAIVEFTATPREQSNILVSVSAGRLKAEEIIKLPVVLTAHRTWQDAIAGAIGERNRLAGLAAQEREYLRPIILFQAQRRDQEVTVQALKRYLVENENIPETSIAVVTGDQRELDQIDIMDRDCPIEHVITIEALKEGWDCPFAYVFCSVANIRSSIAIEQLLGRVLRMPYASKRGQDDLNCAYAHVVDYDGWAAVNNLKDRLTKNMGFEEPEAQEAVRTNLLPLTGGGGPQLEPLRITLDQQVDWDQLPARLRTESRLEWHAETRQPILVTDRPLADDETEVLLGLVAESQRQETTGKIRAHRAAHARLQSPAQQGKLFILPTLRAAVQGELMLAEADAFVTPEQWDLNDSRRFPARLNEGEFSTEREGLTVGLDIAEREGREVLEIQSRAALTLQQPLPGFSQWHERNLAGWLARQCRRLDVAPQVLLKFCLGIVEDQQSRGRTVDELALLKYRLARAITKKLANYRSEALSRAYQQALFSDTAQVEVTFDEAFVFPREYPLIQPYTGSYCFQKHYYGPDHISKLRNCGEEFECARALDRLEEVDYWVRNLDSDPDHSFRLPLAQGWFYPDFVAKLKEGRLMVVEYKGAMLDEPEKWMIGELWAKRSSGKGLFVWAVKQDDQGRSVDQQLRIAVA